MIVAVGLLVVGALLLFLANGQTWASLRVDLPVSEIATGADLAPGLDALALGGLAAGAALLATRGRAKRVVAVLIGLLGLGSAVLSAHGAGNGDSLKFHSPTHNQGPSGVYTGALHGISHTAWPWVALIGGLFIAAAGVPGWRSAGGGGLSARHDSPSTPPPTRPDTEVAIWGALDRGEDPTDGV